MSKLLFPTSVVGSMPRPDFVRDLISEDLGQGWPLYSWPTIVIIDRNMVIHGGIHGFSEEWIETNIQKLL